MDPTAFLTLDPATATRVPDYVWAALASSVVTLALALGFAPRRATPARTETAPEACDFIVTGGSLRAVTEPARALVESLGPGPARLAALTAHLAADCPDIQKTIEALILYGTPFRHHCQRRDGTAIELTGEPRGAAAWLSIRAASEDARALREAQAALGRTRAEARFLAEVLDRAPLIAWSQTPDGQIDWANAAYRDRFAPPAGDLPDHRIPNAFGHVLEEVPLTPRAGGSRRRVAIAGPRHAEPNWFELSHCPGATGETLSFALETDDLVAAEASLRRFVETLTETFAHLPIGLAVFDKNRRLGLFNPALTDLVKIDAVWLAGRPSLRDFLERLRETRQMPEQKDFAAWRRKLGELEEGARDGTYEENWVLPSGKIFRVTGRPHPQGALAFLFEDISTAIHLERRYRSELELSQATLDRMAEAVAVFDTSGMLVFVNSAFESLWGLDPMTHLEGPGVAELTRLWAERCAPSEVWARLREFATAADARASWTAALEMRDGRVLQVLVAPLPDASALIVFRNLSDEQAEHRAARAGLDARNALRERDALLDELAQAQLELPVEAAVRQLMAAIPAAPSPEAFQALGSAAQGLKDGLARARELRGLAAVATATGAASGPTDGLAALLAARGLALTVTGAQPETPELRRACWAVALAAADLAAEGTSIELALEDVPGEHRITAETLRGDGASERVSLALARRTVEGAGGSLRVGAGAADGRVALIAVLPREPVAAAPPAVARSA